MKNVRHSSEQPKWGTSPEVIRVAQATLGVARMMRGLDHVAAIYVDPFSEIEFNQHVGAHRILTGQKGLDGYRDRWLEDTGPRADQVLAGMASAASEDAIGACYTAMVNPPGDDSGENVKRAWHLLDEYHRLRWIDTAVWVAFNLNQMQTLQRCGSERHPLHGDFVRCVPARRLPFVSHSSRVTEDDAPSHPMFFVLLPSHDERIAAEQMRIFDAMASGLGAVL